MYYAIMKAPPEAVPALGRLIWNIMSSSESFNTAKLCTQSLFRAFNAMHEQRLLCMRAFCRRAYFKKKKNDTDYGISVSWP